jgi:hypothetical protein
MTGSGIFGILCKPYLAWIIGDYGWRAGYVAIGVLPLAIALPVFLVRLRDPTDAGEAGHRPAAALSGMSRGEALRSWRRVEGANQSGMIATMRPPGVK